MSNEITNSINNGTIEQGGYADMIPQDQSMMPIENVMMKSVYDPRTGKTIITDGQGRRVRIKRDMTGTQLVRINSMRNQMGLPYLKEHNVTMMTIDSASLMIDDLLFFIRKEQQNQMQLDRLNAILKALHAEYPQNVDHVLKRLDMNK
jgi:hypothetical protein